MKNFIQPGKVLDHTAGGTITSGAIVTMGKMAGIATADAESGEKVGVAIEGVYEVAKDNSDVAVGDYLYVSSGAATKTVSTNVFLGFAVEAAGTGVAKVKVLLRQTGPDTTGA